MPIYDNCHRVLHSFRNVYFPHEYTYLYIVEREGKKEGGGRQRGGREEIYRQRGGEGGEGDGEGGVERGGPHYMHMLNLCCNHM